MKYSFEQTVTTTPTTLTAQAAGVPHALNGMKAANVHQLQTDGPVTFEFRTGTQTKWENAGIVDGFERFNISGVTSVRLTAVSADVLVTYHGV